MQQAVSWWRETGEGIDVDFTIHPCGAREAFAGAREAFAGAREAFAGARED